MSASLSMPAPAQSRVQPFLSADVGGTHVRVGLVRARARDAHDTPELLDYQKYRCADYPSLDEILVEFLRQSGHPQVSQGIIASAGYALEDGSVIASNLPWPLKMQHMQHRLSLQSLHLVNDFEAVAYAAPQMQANEVLHVCGPLRANRAGPALILGPGTGLGAAVWIPTQNGEVVLSTEAGQAALSATTDVELAVLQELRLLHDHVSVERLISGPGLLTLYQILARLRGATATMSNPAEVSAAAVANTDPIARETVLAFAGLLGSVLGDMALLYGVQQGIYLAGGFLPQLGDLLMESSFAERFLSKGNMRPALEQIPVKVIEHGQLGVIGAAIWLMRNTLQ